MEQDKTLALMESLEKHREEYASARREYYINASGLVCLMPQNVEDYIDVREEFLDTLNTND